MTTEHFHIYGSILALGFGFFACSDDNKGGGKADGGVDAGDGGGAGGAAGDAGMGEGGAAGDASMQDGAAAGGVAGDSGVMDGSSDAAEGGAMARVRVAHLSPDAPAVQVCARVGGSGDYDIALTETLGGLSDGLSYKDVSAYIDVPAAQFDVKVITADTDCASGAAVLEASLPELGDGDVVTVFASGRLDADGDAGAASTLDLKWLMDDLSGDDNASLRFVHASDNTPAVDVGVYGDGGAFVKPFASVTYAESVGDPAYTTALPSIDDSVGFEVRVPALLATYATVALPSGVMVGGGDVATVFAYGELDTTSGLSGVGALACVDTAPGSDGLATCVDMEIVDNAARARVRAAHLSPDAPAVRVCVKSSTFDEYTEVVGSLGYPAVTSSLELPADEYDVKIVATASCDDDGAASATATVTAGLSATIAAGGLLDPGDAGGLQPLGLDVFVNETKVPDASKSYLRFIHLGVGAPAVDVGLVDGGITKVWNDASFGGVGSGTGVSDNGYIAAGPLSNASVGVTAAGSSDIVASTAAAVSTDADTIYTAFAVGVFDAGTGGGLGVYLCDDSTDGDADLLSCVGPVALTP